MSKAQSVTIVADITSIMSGTNGVKPLRKWQAIYIFFLSLFLLLMGNREYEETILALFSKFLPAIPS